jgi:hypothetical protein
VPAESCALWPMSAACASPSSGITATSTWLAWLEADAPQRVHAPVRTD